MKYCEGKTMCFRKPSVIAYAAVVGKAENEGPYGGEFDEVVEDNKAGSDTWEQAESLFQQRAVGHVLRKSGLEPDRIDLMIAGDLLNQCVGSSYGLKDYFIPYLGIYGACSTFAEGLLLSAALVNAGYIDTAIASTSSHFSTAERQFRFPLNYGGVRTPTAQWTATAAGAALVGFSGKPPFIRAATVGKIEDMGITDLNNMGAAMAGAAYDTLIPPHEAPWNSPAGLRRDNHRRPGSGWQRPALRPVPARRRFPQGAPQGLRADDLRPRRPGRTRRRLRVRVLRFDDVRALLQADTGRRAETRSLLRDRRADVTYGRSAGREHSRDRALRGDIIGSRRLTR